MDPEDNKREYLLTEEEQNKSAALYMANYNRAILQTIQSFAYGGADNETRAALLEAAKTDVTDETKDEFFEWLKDTGVKSTLRPEKVEEPTH